MIIPGLWFCSSKVDNWLSCVVKTRLDLAFLAKKFLSSRWPFRPSDWAIFLASLFDSPISLSCFSQYCFWHGSIIIIIFYLRVKEEYEKIWEISYDFIFISLLCFRVLVLSEAQVKSTEPNISHTSIFHLLIGTFHFHWSGITENLKCLVLMVSGCVSLLSDFFEVLSNFIPTWVGF